jgi:hypothetical protein
MKDEWELVIFDLCGDGDDCGDGYGDGEGCGDPGGFGDGNVGRGNGDGHSAGYVLRGEGADTGEVIPRSPR